MTQVARYLQASQFCYKELRFTSRPRSPWMSNIQAKVEDSKTSIEILEKVKSNFKLSHDEKINAQKCMRALNLKLSKPRHDTEGIVKLNERTSIYLRKLDTYLYLSRIEYRKQNSTFELYRRKFYRNLSSESQLSHSVTSNEIKDFWSTMWNKKDDEGHYDDYLMEYAPDGMEVKFTSFEEILVYLTNWKVDGFLNIF